MVESLLYLFISSYTFFTFALYYLWNRIETFPLPVTLPDGELKVSVIIPVRNEQENIAHLLSDLEKQTLPYYLFEVWVVDDASTDNTANIVRELSSRSSMRIRLVLQSESNSASPKKEAIQRAISLANCDIIVTTDGDCRVTPDWLLAHLSAFVNPEIQLCSGPVTFLAEKKPTDYLQTVEFSSLVGSGACCIAIKRPTMSNGANLSYRKSAFLSVDGFKGTDQIASGDDEFLMHKIHANYPNSVCFLKTPHAIVRTASHDTWSGFYQQRKRWASKWTHYRSAYPKILAGYIFLINFSLIVAVFFMLTGNLSGYTLTALILLKILPEWLFISTLLRFLEKGHCIPAIPLVQLIYPFYVVTFGLSGQSKSYQWKGRVLK